MPEAAKPKQTKPSSKEKGGINMAKKIFISPSNQTDNAYAYGNTTEAVQCGRIAAALETALKRCGFETMLRHYDTMASKVSAANTWGADLYMPIHTNAFNGQTAGTRMFAYDTTGEGYKACQAIFKYLAPLTPGTSENIKAYPELYEIRNPDAPTAYTEVDFHDNATVAKWIIEHPTEIGEAIAHGVCDYFGYTYVTAQTGEVKTEDTTPDVLYLVQIGAFGRKANADALAKRLDADGYEVYIKTVKK